MQIGLHALGIGTGAQPEIVRAVASAAEQAGFATLWAGEHVIMVDRPRSRYPYAADGQIAVPAEADWLDPLLTLGYAAAVTARIGLATGILLLPEHNPLIVAKQAATLDRLSVGRFTLGAGIGWSADEYAALGVPFAGRGARAVEYIAAMRALWSDDVASYTGVYADFSGVRLYPKPARRRIPVVLGGNSDPALDRAGAIADGWYGFNVAREDVAGRVAALHDAARRHGRDPGQLSIAVAVSDCEPEDLGALTVPGMTQFVIVGSPPGDAAGAAGWVSDLAVRWGLAGPRAGRSGGPERRWPGVAPEQG